MHTFIMQDWITIRGAANTVTQSESEWLDLAQYQDVVLWIDAREFVGTVTLNIQTAPTKDESFFSVGTVFTTTLALGPTAPQKVLLSVATVPLARYLRWQLTSATNPFDATFRIMISANAPGI